ncbi:hypothetical protein MNBD_GAMMA25-992 [hydrothermal vent metagenome]|uniref:Lipoprotein n=1 Tax=hydrothermal vent metagenome TaxID=652676 RepID=A0A3B1B2P1_9ZZZZ
MRILNKIKSVVIVCVTLVLLTACSATGGQAKSKFEVADKNSYEYHVMCAAMLETMAAKSLPEDMKLYMTAKSSIKSIMEEKFPKIKKWKQRDDISDVSSNMYGMNRDEFIGLFDRNTPQCLAIYNYAK